MFYFPKKILEFAPYAAAYGSIRMKLIDKREEWSRIQVINKDAFEKSAIFKDAPFHSRVSYVYGQNPHLSFNV